MLLKTNTQIVNRHSPLYFEAIKKDINIKTSNRNEVLMGVEDEIKNVEEDEALKKVKTKKYDKNRK